MSSREPTGTHLELARCKENKEKLIAHLEILAREKVATSRKNAELRVMLRGLAHAAIKVIQASANHTRHTGHILPFDEDLKHLEDMADGSVELF